MHTPTHARTHTHTHALSQFCSIHMLVGFTRDGCECARDYCNGTNIICIVQVLVVEFTGDGCECATDYCSGTINICIVQVLVVDVTCVSAL